MRFLEAWEKVRQFKEDKEDAAISAIFTGVNVADGFWENFITVCNNREGISSLLNVSPEKVASWPSEIQKYLDKSKNHKNPEEKEQTKVLDTGTGEL